MEEDHGGEAAQGGGDDPCTNSGERPGEDQSQGASRVLRQLVVDALPPFQAKDLISCQSFASVTKAIRDSVSEIDDRYLQSFKDFGAVVDGLEEEPSISWPWCPRLEMSSWLTLAFFPAYAPVEGQMVFLASCRKKGAVDVVIALHKNTPPLFRRIERWNPWANYEKHFALVKYVSQLYI